MDIFKEQLVKKQSTKADKSKKISLAVIAACLSGILFLLLRSLSIILIILLWIGYFYLLKNMTVEFEYILTNDELDIDKITGQNKRKRLITVNISQASEFFKYTDSDEDKLDDEATYVYSDDCTNTDLYVLKCKHKEHGDTYIFFSPSKEMAGLISDFLPMNIRQKVKTQLGIDGVNLEK